MRQSRSSKIKGRKVKVVLIFVLSTLKTEMEISSNYVAFLEYRTRAIITRGLYTFYPLLLFEVHLCTVTFGLMYGTCLSSLGVPWHIQILADQLTLFHPGGTDYAHLITTGTPGFSDLPTALHLNNRKPYNSGAPYVVRPARPRSYLDFEK